MSAIITDLHSRLSAALPVPVLRLEQADQPRQAAPMDARGRPTMGSGERGLGAYLTTHPQGFIQLEEPQGVSDDGLVAVFWIPVAALAPTSELAEALAFQVRRVLCGTPYEPGPYISRLPDTSNPLPGGNAYLCRPTYEIRTIDGVLAV